MFARKYDLNRPLTPTLSRKGAREVCILSPTRERTEVRGIGCS
jgi:hypothetical protein